MSPAATAEKRTARKGTATAPKAATGRTGTSAAGKAFVVVRIRGTVNVNGKVKDTMRMLRVQFPNHCVVVPATEANMGMIRKVQDYVAYGEADGELVAELIRQRGRTVGDAPVTDEFVKNASDGKYADIAAFARAVSLGEATLRDLGEDLKPLFRLAPPRGGHGTIKRHVRAGGPLGYHGAAIGELVRRMI